MYSLWKTSSYILYIRRVNYSPKVHTTLSFITNSLLFVTDLIVGCSYSVLHRVQLYFAGILVDKSACEIQALIVHTINAHNQDMNLQVSTRERNGFANEFMGHVPAGRFFSMGWENGDSKRLTFEPNVMRFEAQHTKDGNGGVVEAYTLAQLGFVAIAK